MHPKPLFSIHSSLHISHHLIYISHNSADPSRMCTYKCKRLSEGLSSVMSPAPLHDTQLIDLRARLVVWAENVEYTLADLVEHVEHSLFGCPSAGGLVLRRLGRQT